MIHGDAARRHISYVTCALAIVTLFSMARAEVFQPNTNSPYKGDRAQVSAGAEDRGCGVKGGVFTHGSRKGRQIALTFDACPTSFSPSFTPAVVDYLEKERIPATFFVSGAWAESNRDNLRRLGSSSFFEIALHGNRHPRLRDDSPDTILTEIEDGRMALLRLGATPAPLFRPPYGDRPNELASVARQTGVLPVIFDVVMGDPDPFRTADVMERDAIRWVQGGSIIIMHVNGRGYATAETVRNIVPSLQAHGYTFVKVSDLVRECNLPAIR